MLDFEGGSSLIFSIFNGEVLKRWKFTRDSKSVVSDVEWRAVDFPEENILYDFEFGSVFGGYHWS